jgi:hypothetical protein
MLNDICSTAREWSTLADIASPNVIPSICGLHAPVCPDFSTDPLRTREQLDTLQQKTRELLGKWVLHRS